MYDILVYLFENYQHPNALPEGRALFRRLSALGFDNHEIREVLTWLSRLGPTLVTTAELDFISKDAFRIFDKTESSRLNLDCQGFLHFLQAAGVIDARSRELIIEMALALKDMPLSLEKLKVITLFVLWSGDTMPDSLVLDELLSDGSCSFH